MLKIYIPRQGETLKNKQFFALTQNKKTNSFFHVGACTTVLFFLIHFIIPQLYMLQVKKVHHHLACKLKPLSIKKQINVRYQSMVKSLFGIGFDYF